MRIEIDDKYVLKSDSRSFMICTKQLDKDGNSCDRADYHYTDFHSAISGLARIKILKSKAVTFAGLNKDLFKIYAEIAKIRAVFADTIVLGG